MYEPVGFRVDDKAEMVALIRAFPLGLLIAPRAGEGFFASADLVPFLIDDGGIVLRAHVAAANPLCAALAEPRDVLVVFQGPQAYVSPTHYPSKRAHGRVVPTWNYTMVQAEGMARRRDEAEWKAAQSAALTTIRKAAARSLGRPPTRRKLSSPPNCAPSSASRLRFRRSRENISCRRIGTTPTETA